MKHYIPYLFLLSACGRIGYYPLSIKEDVGDVDKVVYVDHFKDASISDSSITDAKIDSNIIVPCGGGSFIKSWDFSSNVDGFDSSSPGPKPIWNSSFGHNKSGSLEMSFVEGKIQGWVYYINSDPAIKNKTFSAWFYMEGGVNALAYSQGPNSGYNSNNVTFFDTGVWTCAQLKVGDDADMLGFGLNGIGPAKFYMDEFGYE